jgi:hypothetical protein
MNLYETGKLLPEVYHRLNEIEINVAHIELTLQREREVKLPVEFNFEPICESNLRIFNINSCLKETNKGLVFASEGTKLPVSGFFSYESTSGTHYKGEWKNNKFHGTGLLVDWKGNTFIGEFSEGKLHGNVLVKYYDGSVFRGKYFNNSKNGPGKLLYSNGNYLVVNWVNNLPEGWGKLHDYEDLLLFEGDYKNGLKHGIGFEVIVDTGDKYFGEYQNGCIHGLGKYIFASGVTYVGEFQYGMKHGVGKIIGKHFFAVCIFDNDRVLGNVDVTWDDGSKFFGICKKGSFFEGVLDLKHSVYRGSWVNGVGEIIKKPGWY